LSYNRFVETMPELLVPLAAFMQSRCGSSQGIAFIDSTPFVVCKNIRIPRHKTFKMEAGRGKSSNRLVLWFQVASGRQRPGKNPVFLCDARQR
jgi:hypothetical protein